MQKTTVASAFKSWLRRISEPARFIRNLSAKLSSLKDNLRRNYGRKKKARIKTWAEFVEMRKFDNFQFNLLTSEEREIFFKNKATKKSRKKYGLKCYQFAPEKEKKEK